MEEKKDDPAAVPEQTKKPPHFPKYDEFVPQVFTTDVDPYLADVKIHLRDYNSSMTAAWTTIFTDESVPAGISILDEEHKQMIKDNFTISTGDIFYEKDKSCIRTDAIVSPANSFGFMDGGIDMVYCERFGWQILERLQRVIQSEYFGEIPVGSATIIEALDPKETIKYMVSAPTMRVPDDVSGTPNAYLAFRATLIEVQKHNKAVILGEKQGERIRSILCPGLGTAVGRMAYLTCAYQMLRAYQTVALGRIFPHGKLFAFKAEHWDMIRERLSKEDLLAKKKKKKHIQELERLAAMHGGTAEDEIDPKTTEVIKEGDDQANKGDTGKDGGKPKGEDSANVG